METNRKHLEIDKFEPPGGFLIWIVIFIEMITFALALIFFIYNGKGISQVYHDSAAELNKIIGFANTLVLLTSGFTMAESLKYFKSKQTNKYKIYLLFTILLGITFVTLKSIEYYAKIQHGIGFDTNTFYTYYWMLTGFHLIHVLFGLTLLSYFYFKNYNIKNEDLEATASFWHMCDLIWLLIFPIIYLIY